MGRTRTHEVIERARSEEYYDVKNTIALPELVAIHQADLMDRPGDFGADFLGRGGLAGSLFSAVDYVQAQRFQSWQVLCKF